MDARLGGLRIPIETKSVSFIFHYIIMLLRLFVAGLMLPFSNELLILPIRSKCTGGATGGATGEVTGSHGPTGNIGSCVDGK